ncbi:hypothetical protein ABC502_00575 [Alkalimonas sp. NCh-2]|uniref:hypothetical protein n=1 Tax=Alkalimonas sp. NCh-2 TaxID=3144846 RepID=UPI0031F6D17C
MINELIALKVKEEQLKDSGSLNHHAFNDITDLRNTLTASLPPESRAEIDHVVSGFVHDFLNGSLANSGGFQQSDEPAITALPNPVPGAITPTVLDNTPPDIPGDVGGFEAGEDIAVNTETPVHEGHWSDSIYFSEDGSDVEKIYSASGQPELREIRRPAFDAWQEDGIPDTDYTLNPHAYNSLFKSGRKDIMPDDVLDALSSNSMPGENGSLKFVNPVTGTRVFVNPKTKQVVGIQPGDFGD